MSDAAYTALPRVVSHAELMKMPERQRVYYGEAPSIIRNATIEVSSTLFDPEIISPREARWASEFQTLSWSEYTGQ